MLSWKHLGNQIEGQVSRQWILGSYYVSDLQAANLLPQFVIVSIFDLPRGIGLDIAMDTNQTPASMNQTLFDVL